MLGTACMGGMEMVEFSGLNHKWRLLLSSEPSKLVSAAFDKTNGLVKRSQIASVEVNFVFWTDQGAKIERKLQLWLSWVEKKPEWTCRKYSSHVHTRFVEPTKPGLYMLLPIFCSMLTRSGSGNDPKRLLGFHRQPESGTQYLAWL